MLLTSLWTLEDENDREILRNAERKGDLLGALFAIEGCSLEERETACHTLAAWSQQVQQRLDQSMPPLEALRAVLVDDLSLRGDQDDYYHPRNSHLSVVLRRRQGLPILVSAVWLLVAETNDIKLHGVGMPGHFLLGFDGAEKTWIDPFDEGRSLDITQCQAIVSRLSQGRLPWDDAYLAPTNMEDMLERILRNLLNAYAQHDDIIGLYRTLCMLATLQPHRLDLYLQQGRIAEFIGDFHRALLDYQTYLAQAAQTENPLDEEELLSVQKKVARLKQQHAMPN